MRFKKVYIEITNVCNMNCSFCHGTKRTKRFMSTSEFDKICKKLKNYTQYIYLHVLGEPLLHPELPKFLEIAYKYKLKVSLTTNGTLLDKSNDFLINSSSLYKVCISLHSFEANSITTSLENYLRNACLFSKNASQNGIICVLRLWNGDAENMLNNKIKDFVFSYFGLDNVLHENNIKLKDKVYLEYAMHFEWPDMSAPKKEKAFCMGLRDQIGVLVDGTIIPCCLDSEGHISLGNIFSDNIADVIESDKFNSIYNGFSHRKPIEELCKHCGYTQRFD